MLAAFILNLLFSFSLFIFLNFRLIWLVLPSCHLSFQISNAGRNTAETSAEAATNGIEKQKAYAP